MGETSHEDRPIRRVVVGVSFPVPISRVTACGSAAPTLMGLAEDAELLVVGSRGLGTFASLVLGSVSQQCAHDAPCPVMIVPLPGP
jgi:nucleotide-binding universal stress UspA family protein